MAQPDDFEKKRRGGTGRAPGETPRIGIRPYAIMRHAKLKSWGNIAASLEHTYRDRETHNADPERTPDNVHLVSASKKETIARMKARLPEKIRKNGVMAVEYLMTASPEWWAKASKEEQSAFFKRSMSWLEAQYGKDNIMQATIHHDETSPHLTAMVVPITKDGRLCARDYLGGRAKLQAAQTSYATAVSDLGLARGIPGSKATHRRIKDYYAALEAPQRRSAPIVDTDLKPRRKKGALIARESREEVTARLNRKLLRETRDLSDQAESGAAASERVKAVEATQRELMRANVQLRSQTEVHQRLFDGLTPDQAQQIIDQIRPAVEQADQFRDDKATHHQKDRDEGLEL